MTAAPRTARERVRAELTREIKDEARRQLADVGAHGLSLRAVARELGMVSSALYRYFASRDQLLTALIVDAYNAVGEAAELADPGAGDPRTRWRAIWHATRGWARANPHEYALIHGSPIPGYQAPEDTIGPAARVPLALIAVLRDAHPHEPAVTAPMSAELRAQAGQLTEILDLDAPAEVVTRAIASWTQLFGTINFELFGQYVGSVDPADAYFEHLIGQMADFVGL
ncbi:TetR/AcrR family transcriptional regulator [Amycolatopsis jejuensis]|uniref:TetR/AcrR family transcriptional regulator n=1 Tax=Amycolatopsis jejuensis TaxID=330084 RepID=UPI0005272568|nr:TetR/AcrR family transcriptional regulator [Amycolatopsis jejuensis]